ncbi:MAG TPA: aminoglycoside phosphotransferase family protein [Pilimelia sp.]|nr:aminoglycoside phosphotransferase family protein [Pilimelia sp.]
MSAAPHRDDLEGRLTRPKLHAVLAAVCDRMGFDATGAELIKFTNNAVFRLARVPVVVRIAGSATMRQRAAKVVQVARWLADHDIPAVRLLPDVEQPMEIDGQLATLWQAVPAAGPTPTGADLGRLLRQLHGISTAPVDLPGWNPVVGIRSRLADAEGIDADDQRYLLAVCDEVEAAVATVEYVLPQGFVHGDATVANLIPGPAGPVLCDFDSSSVGPREWDLTPVATGYFRFANRINNLALLATTYRFDITTWEGFPTFRRLRELQLVTSVVPVLLSNPGHREQWAYRLHTFRKGDLAAKWTLY